MNKKIIKLTAIALIAIVLSSCGTILGGKIQTCQKTKPTANEPKRKIRTWALIGDVVFSETVIPLIVDFIDGAIYKPCNKPDKAGNKK